MEFTSILSDLIRQTLPNLLAEKVDLVIHQLVDEIGCEEVADLPKVKTEHFGEQLKPMQIQKLMDAWRGELLFILFIELTITSQLMC